MIIAFILSMPNNNSWNGKWSGEKNLYRKTHNFGNGKMGETRGREILEKGSFYYNFGDGWGASISVREVDAKEAQRLNRVSDGFCGYDWMVDEILDHGRIRTIEEKKDSRIIYETV